MKRSLLLILGVLFLSGCATEKNIQLNDSFWQQKKKVAVTSQKPVKPRVIKVGSQGLLDYAINSAMTNKLDTHLSKTNLGWYSSLSNELAKRLKEKRIPVVVENNHLDKGEKHIANLAAKHNVNDVLVIKLQAVGVIRSYYGFIPTSAPEAYTVLKGELIDTSTKKIKWRHLAEVKLPITGEWDQPPHYPNVTRAVNQAIVTSKQEIFDSFFSGQ